MSDAAKGDVVLDRTGLIQLGGGVTLLLVFGFTAGAVVGFGINRGGAAVPAQGQTPATQTAARPAPAPVRTASTPERCVPAEETLPLRTAEAGLPAVEPNPYVEGDARPSVTATAPAPADDVASLFAPARYAVQLGVFGVESNADRFATDLRRRGYDPRVAAMRSRSGQWMQRVSLAVYDSEDEAELAARAFQVREGIPAVVVALREEEQ